MGRIPVDEIFWQRTKDSTLVHFAPNWSILLVAPGTEEPLTLRSDEEGGAEVSQPLRTGADGRALGEGGVRPWSDTANFDVLVNGERFPRRAASEGGVSVASVNGKTGVVVLAAA